MKLIITLSVLIIEIILLAIIQQNITDDNKFIVNVVITALMVVSGCYGVFIGDKNE